MPLIVLILLLLFVGYLLLLVEIFLLPGFTLPGVLGLASVIGGCYLSWVNYGAAIGGLTLIGSVAVTVISIIVLFHSPLGRRLQLDSVLSKEKGFTAAISNYQSLLGKEGTTITNLRPAGTIEIENERYDVVTDGEFIEKDLKVRVTQVEGNRIVVLKADS